MEYTQRAPQPKSGIFACTLDKIFRLRRSFTSSASEDSCSVHKLKLSQTFSDYSTIISEGGNGFYKVEFEKPQQKLSSKDREAMESPPRSSLRQHLRHQSGLRAAPNGAFTLSTELDTVFRSSNRFRAQTHFGAQALILPEPVGNGHYFRNRLGMVIPFTVSDSSSALFAQIEEQRNLIKTYRIAKTKLESDLKLMEFGVLSLQAELLESEKKNEVLDSKLHPGSSLSSLDGLQLSGVTPNHFLTVLQFAINSIRSFVKVLVKQMESAGWDLDAAASAIQPGLLRLGSCHRGIAFQSYVCQQMFSDFHRKNYNLDGLEDQTMWRRSQFFNEFTELRDIVSLQKLWRHPATGKFLRAKYLSLVHPRMESSFFSNLNHRDAVSSGWSLPNSAFFARFAELARRVWLLHCIFFSFEDTSIFHARKGSRFSEVYMESTAEEINEDDSTAVGFTVVPGFRVGHTVIRCKVYLG